MFQGVAELPVESMNLIWLELLHNLRGQWDSMQGSSDRMINMPTHFQKLWDTIGVYSMQIGLKWNYVTPSYLIIHRMKGNYTIKPLGSFMLIAYEQNGVK